MRNDRIGEVLKEYRKQRKMSVKEVSAALLEKYGQSVAVKTIYGWESNQAHPTSDMLLALCRLYRIERFSVFCGEPESSAMPQKLTLSRKDLLLVKQYQTHTEYQPAVDRLLGLG